MIESAAGLDSIGDELACRLMQIMAEHRWLYPIEWPELSSVIRFGGAEGRCEHCQRPHGERVLHLGDGRWWDEDRRP